MWCSLGCRLQLQVFAADGLKFEHGPLRAWALTSMEAKCLHIESYGGNHSGAMQGTSCHTGFVGEAAAAGAADPKPHRLERQLCSPDKKARSPSQGPMLALLLLELFPMCKRISGPVA